MNAIRSLRVLFVSRGLFRNWLPAGIRYYLARRGVFRGDFIGVVCLDGSRDSIPTHAYGALANDYYDGFLRNYDCVEHMAIYGDTKIPIGEVNIGVGQAIKNGWTYSIEGGYWFKDGVRFRHVHWPILEVFDLGNYEGVDVRGKTVVDVGAFIGDSAIYFALKGARRVIAVEPHPGAYAEMLENVRLNGLESVITPVNAGLVDRPGKICIEDISTDITGGTYHRLGDCPSTIKAVTLGELINGFGIDGDGAVLKMDCEGCEYDVVLNDYEHVRLFREVVFEYHVYAIGVPVTKLINTLNRDFECREINQGFYRKQFSDLVGRLGLIYCMRRW
jgi:FkbM family methyltransferase